MQDTEADRRDQSLLPVAYGASTLLGTMVSSRHDKTPRLMISLSTDVVSQERSQSSWERVFIMVGTIKSRENLQGQEVTSWRQPNHVSSKQVTLGWGSTSLAPRTHVTSALSLCVKSMLSRQCHLVSQSSC